MSKDELRKNMGCHEIVWYDEAIHNLDEIARRYPLGTPAGDGLRMLSKYTKHCIRELYKAKRGI